MDLIAKYPASSDLSATILWHVMCNFSEGLQGDGAIASHNGNPLWMYLLSVSFLSLSHFTYSLIHTFRDHLTK